MHILVLQHARAEHPGKFRDFLREDGHSWEAVELDEGEQLPSSLDGFDALWVLGGPMDVWKEDRHPWLRPEKELIRSAVEERGMPFLGLCLGHQLLAEALGGKCGKAETPEIGVLDVHLTAEGEAGIFFDGLPETFRCLQWHGAEVQQMPAGAKVPRDHGSLQGSGHAVANARLFGTVPCRGGIRHRRQTGLRYRSMRRRSTRHSAKAARNASLTSALGK